MIAAESVDFSTLLIILVGSGGVIGAIVSFLKVSTDKDSAAVAQAHGAMESMRELNESLQDDLRYWRERFNEERQQRREVQEECRRLQDRLDQMEMKWGDLG